MGKRILFLILLTVLLVCPLVSGAETVTADSRIVALHSHFECGCDVMKDGVMISEYGLVTKSNALYCATHGKKYTNITFYFPVPWFSRFYIFWRCASEYMISNRMSKFS